MNGFEFTKEQEREFVINSLDGTIMIDGFVFSRERGNRPCLIIHQIPHMRLGGVINCSKKSIREHIEYINSKHIESIMVCADNIEFINQCQGIKCISIVPASASEKNFDFSPLYRMENLIAVECGVVEGDAGSETTLDFRKIRGIKQVNVYVKNFKGAKGFQDIKNLESLVLGGYDKTSLQDYFTSEHIKYLDLYKCGLKTLNGIEKERELSHLELYGMKRLEDISALKHISSALKELEISGCTKIKDFSVLEEMTNLEHLELRGKNSVPNLKFLQKMKKLKTFVFDINVLDGDMGACMDIPYVQCDKQRRHYNVKNKNLPKDDVYWEWGMEFLKPVDQLV